ncbi:MAG TPA: gamma carbonic anhydrase family protein [Dermatophilaceae bacterium]|nr:gamma carbonic anhydrase family protein [Dermatophilaceae bacterium]
MILEVGEHAPQIAPTAWVAPTATVVGNVVVEAGASIWYGVVIRADRERITVGPDSNIQDNSVLHADPGSPVRIGRSVTVGHSAVVHGCTVEDGSLVGMHSTVLNGAVVGAGSLVAANALVPEGSVVPPRSLVAGVPATVRRELTDEESARLRHSAEVYAALRDLHRTATPGGIPH